MMGILRLAPLLSLQSCSRYGSRERAPKETNFQVYIGHFIAYVHDSLGASRLARSTSYASNSPRDTHLCGGRLGRSIGWGEPRSIAKTATGSAPDGGECVQPVQSIGGPQSQWRGLVCRSWHIGGAVHSGR